MVEGSELRYTQLQFAGLVGLSKQAIGKAISEDRVIVEMETGLIDPKYPTNIAFVQKVISSGRGKGIAPEYKRHMCGDFSPEELKPKRKGRPPGSKTKKKTKKKESLPTKPKSARALKAYKSMAEKLEARTTVDDPDSEDLFDKLMSQGLLQPGEQLKIAQTALANLRIAKEMDDLITKEMVIQCFSRLSGIMSSRLLCLGQRSAKQLCGIFDQTSPEKEIEVQKVLDDEVASAVDAIQREISDVINW